MNKLASSKSSALPRVCDVFAFTTATAFHVIDEENLCIMSFWEGNSCTATPINGDKRPLQEVASEYGLCTEDEIGRIYTRADEFEITFSEREI